jgi:hypothetical protein
MKLRKFFGTFVLLGLAELRADEVTKWNLIATTAAFAAGQNPWSMSEHFCPFVDCLN